MHVHQGDVELPNPVNFAAASAPVRPRTLRRRSPLGGHGGIVDPVFGADGVVLGVVTQAPLVVAGVG